MKKNDCFEIEIVDVGIAGEGIGRYDGMTFFIKDAVIGDRLVARATKIKKNYGYARVEEIINPSTFRVTPKCPVARQCGGCQLQAMDYQAQLRMKQQLVKERLIRIGGFEEKLIDAVMEPIIGQQEEDDRGPFYFRNKAQYPVQRDAAGRTVIGFYAAHSHRIVETAHCCIGSEDFDAIVEVIRNSKAVVPYDEQTGRGLLRHVLLRRGIYTGQLMVCFVVNTDGPTKQSERMVGELIRELDRPGITSYCVNYNNSRSNVILGRRTETVCGNSYIEDRMDGIWFHISAPSFYQVNTRQAEQLYRKAVEYAGLTGKEAVWDLYCGIGTISLFLARHAGRVYGVEVVPEAIENARENARLNGIENVQFFLGKAEEVLPEYYGQSGEEASCGERDHEQKGKYISEDSMRHPDVIVVDPPRKGCDEKCLATMLAMRPFRIVYVSCDPATLARDLRILCDGGYQMEKVTAVDQFCHSVHVETVVGLQRIDM